MKRLKGKVAVVTGAGSGIGEATAIQLAKEGCQLAISDVNPISLETTRLKIDSLGVKVSAKILNVANKQDFFEYADEVFNEFGQVNLVINNAGVAVSATIENTTLDDFEWLMGINFWGMVYGTKAFLPYLKKSGDGHIANVSSIFGFMAPAESGAYNCSKFAIRGFNETLRMELDLENCGVSCSSIHPGLIKTNIVLSTRYDESRLEKMGGSEQEAQDRFTKFAFTSAEKAAIVIVKGIKKNKMRILIGPDAVFVDWMTRLFPLMWRKLAVYIARVGRRQRNKNISEPRKKSSNKSINKPINKKSRIV